MEYASEHPSLHHQSLVRVCGITEKAFAKRDRRKTKRTTKATSGGKTVNKSCDTCSTKKRRCDGGRPCSRCEKRGDGHKCTYSTRRPYTRNQHARLWSSLTSSPEQEAVGTASAARMRPCRKTSMGTHCHDNNRDQQNTSWVIEASPPLGFMVTPKRECSPPAIDEVYAELARAQQGMASLIVSTNSLPLQASNTGPYQQTTSIKQHCVPCGGDSSKLDGVGSVGDGYVEMMPRTVSLEEQSNSRSSDVPGLEIDCPVVASSASATESDSSTTDDEGSDSSTLDLDTNNPSYLSDDGMTIVHDIATISFDQHLPRTCENIADITTAALRQEEQQIISAEDWFDFAANL